jgi:hypothetical protein
MAKKGMKRPQIQGGPPKNYGFVPEIQGKAKAGNKKAKPIIAGTMGAELKVWHEKPISKAYRQIDTDLARDNLENDIPFADLQDL